MMTLEVRCRTFLLLFGSIISIHSPTAADLYESHSSCQANSKWTRGHGLMIKSWLQSVVPVRLLNSSSSSDPIQNTLGVQILADLDTSAQQLATNVLLQVSSSHPRGQFWKRFGQASEAELSGWLYGQSRDHPSLIEAPSGEDLAFVYPDLKTAIRGRFKEGVLVEGRATKVLAFRCFAGTVQLKFAPIPPDAPTYSYEEVTDTFLTSQPTLMDPFDRAHVYIGPSTLKNGHNMDGLFARQAIPANSLVAVYAGFKVYDQRKLFHGNMTREQEEDVHKNLIHYNEDYELNITPEYSDIVVYRATLAHKCNHKFVKASVDFDYLVHPRFGPIRCLRSLRRIDRGEELFVNYNYDAEDEVPIWYEHLRASHNRKKLSDILKRRRAGSSSAWTEKLAKRFDGATSGGGRWKLFA